MPHLSTLPNGVRVVVLPFPDRATASVSVFVRSGSQHERGSLNGIGHVIEHMAFKGTDQRTCQQINLDAERLGAEVNAHTDKDHTAYHMRGHARDAATFIDMMGDIVQRSTFPEEELARERKVLLQELAEDEDDGMSTAFKLFDRACYGEHPTAQPVIGSRANLRRFTRDDLVGFVGAQYTGANTIVGVAGRVDPAQMVEAARRAFGDMPAGAPNTTVPPSYRGGLRFHRLAGGDQVHIVIGFPVPRLSEDHAAFRVAAAILGEGMSSPLLDRVRERRGLVYHADCYADVRDAFGQLIIEASTAPHHLDEFVTETTTLLRQQIDAIDPVDLERARNQLTVRLLFDHDSPGVRLEAAAIDLFALGRVRSQAEVLDAFAAVDAGRARDAFARMLEAGAAVGLAGNVDKRGEDRMAKSVRALRTTA